MNVANPMRLMTGVSFLLITVLGFAGCPPVEQPRPDPDGRPTADFTWSATGSPLTIDFNDLSTGGEAPVRTWRWEFGDGTVTSEEEPTHTYSTAGTYTVRLTVSTRLGSDSVTRQVQAFGGNSDPPEASFIGNPLTGNAPLTVNFQDLSQTHGAPITGWSWEFGDGDTSGQRNPAHTYTSPGTYRVRLTVDSALGPDTVARENYVVVTASGVPPVANFTGTPTAGVAPLTVQFDDLSANGGAAITGWQWQFGDGATSTQREPEHTYTQPGAYTVVLRVTSAQGSDIRTRAGYVVVDPAQTNTPPVANFSATPESGSTPLVVRFTDTSAPGTAAITAWLWTFGDGGTSTSSDPQHTYTAPGTFTVSLRVTTAHGADTRTRAGLITVTQATRAPDANFTQTTATGAAPLNVVFTDASSAGSAPISAWLWTFGDGATSTLRNPSHTYTTAGTYTVSLQVTSAHGTDTLVKPGAITVQPNAQAEYDRGFEAGFAVDEEYWNGYFDSWDTLDGGEIYYDTSHIQFYDEISYRAGYWDGIWYAYNDGYFVAYDYAFTIGFSEGYDLAYYPDWYDFLLEDEHLEWLDGGFSDGYEDGFTEGRIFGAVDYDGGLPFDWMDALDFYWEGNDVYIEELDLGTGEFGPAVLYQHGQDPYDLIEKGITTPQARPDDRRKVTPMRKTPGAVKQTEDWVVENRPLIAEAEDELDVWPQFSPRSEFELDLETTWLERIQAYFGL